MGYRKIRERILNWIFAWNFSSINQRIMHCLEMIKKCSHDLWNRERRCHFNSRFACIKQHYLFSGDIDGRDFLQ
jgi:hypothetical protein